MSWLAEDLSDLLAEVAAVTARLGVENETELAAVRDLLSGPPVVLVTGPPRADRTKLAVWLAETLPEVTVDEADVPGVPSRLWDVLVLGTPADRLLPIDEQEMLAAQSRHGRVVLVAVTGLHRLGDGPELAANRAELERLRLRPFLTPLGLRWWFLGPGGNAQGLASEVIRRCEASSVHDSSVRAALRTVCDTAIALFAPRVVERENDLDLLGSVRQQLGPAAAEARERTRIRAMTAEDALRESVDRFYEEVAPTCDRAMAWLSNGGITPWEDVVQPLDKSWATLLEQVQHAVPQHASALHAELDRTIRAQCLMAEKLGVTVTPVSFADRRWVDAAIAEPMNRLTSIELGPALAKLAHEVGRYMPSAEESEPEWDSRMAQFVRRVGDEIDGRLGIPIRDRLAGELDKNLRAIVQLRATDAAEGIRQLVETEGGADSTTVADWLESTARTVSDTVAERYRWYPPYRDLLAVRDRL